MCVALVALDAVVRTRGPRGERSIPIVDFHILPGDHPERETALEHGELITAVDLPAMPFAARSHYLKVRDRASYAFALVSVAAIIDSTRGRIRSAQLAFGGGLFLGLDLHGGASVVLKPVTPGPSGVLDQAISIIRERESWWQLQNQMPGSPTTTGSTMRWHQTMPEQWTSTASRVTTP